MKKRLIAYLLTLLFSFSCVDLAIAHSSAAEHWADMSKALFGYKMDLRSEPASIHPAIKKLRYATQLCIDQFGGSGGTYLTGLEVLKVPNLPTLSEINLDARATTHRKPTHRGWTYDYSKYSKGTNKAWASKIWPKRKQLLLTTVENVFNFNGAPDWADRFLATDPRCDAFAAILYYIHLLGDHNEFDENTYPSGKESIIPLAGTYNLNLISEMRRYFSILFGIRKSATINRRLEEVNHKICTLYNTNNFPANKEEFDKYHNYTVEILDDILAVELPKLLKEEPFFQNVFQK